MLTISKKIPLIHNFKFYYNKKLSELKNKIISDDIVIKKVLFTENKLGIFDVLENKPYEITDSQKATLSYLQHVACLDDPDSYTILNENGIWYAQVKKYIVQRINLSLEKIASENNEVEVFKYIQHLFSRNCPLFLFQQKSVISETMLNFELYLEKDEDLEECHISLLNVSVNKEEVTLKNLFYTLLSEIPQQFEDLFPPIYEILELYESESYNANIEEYQEGDPPSISGFNVDKNKIEKLKYIANKLILLKNIDQQRSFIKQFVKNFS